MVWRKTPTLANVGEKKTTWGGRDKSRVNGGKCEHPERGHIAKRSVMTEVMERSTDSRLPRRQALWDLAVDSTWGERKRRWFPAPRAATHSADIP